jgi:hypothetical protein
MASVSKQRPGFLDVSRETPTLLGAHTRAEASSLAVLSEATPSGSVV